MDCAKNFARNHARQSSYHRMTDEGDLEIYLSVIEKDERRWPGSDPEWGDYDECLG